MYDAKSDRNILFGLVALHMGHVSRAALLAGVKVWIQDKSRPLGQILVEQQVLTPDSRVLLEALVDKHLELHGHDVEKGLASLSSVGSVRQDLELLADADVAATIDLVPRGQDAGPVAEIGAGMPSSKGGRFRIVRPHAKGGLGVVFVARDEELHREVALKEIQDRHSGDEESRTRFMLEAEITGGLEHPGIVPVYGLGKYADGRPFYAMRFIRGGSLKDAIAEFHRESGAVHGRNVAFRELLERFIDVCNAIQYAHDRGVLHRDLKPGNIMLGKYGETLVVDWGLAKPMSETAVSGRAVEEPILRPASASGSAATMQGSAVGTPQYMSPEQAAGQLDLLGPASDIYSLGATLYSLLTGRAPFERRSDMGRSDDIPSILKRVQAGDFPLPRQVKSDVDPALEAICLKAMALNPKDRYLTPAALIDDLKNWLADEPVAAYPDPWTVKARRWIGKHRTLVTGFAAAFGVGLISLAMATVLLTNANRLITQQNDEIKREVAEKEKQRKLAESRLQQSLAAVGLFANDARRYCEDALVPGDSRIRLYEVLIKQLEEQAEQETGEATLDSLRNKALMYQTLCSVTGDFFQDTKNQIAFDKGIRTVDAWERIRPGDAAARSYRAAFLHLRARVLSQLQKTDDARQYSQQALALRRALVGDPDVELGTKIDNVTALADSLDSLDLYEESLTLREKVCKLFEADEMQADKNTLRAVRQRSYPYRDAWCWTYLKAGLHASDYATRKKYLMRADEMCAVLMPEREANRALRLRWATVAKMLGELEYNHGKLAEKGGKKQEAEKFFADAAIHYARLNRISKGLATSSELVDGLRDYARSYYTVALAEQRKGNAVKARALFEQSRRLREQTLRDYENHPIAAHLQIDLFFSQVALGDFRNVIEQLDGLELVFRDEPDASYRLACIYALAIEAVAESRKPGPLTLPDKRLQARLRSGALQCLQAAHDGGFRDFFQTSIDSDFDAIRDDPAMKEFEAAFQYRLGVRERKSGDAGKARTHFETAENLAAEWLRDHPKSPRARLIQIDRLCIQTQLGKTESALLQANKLLPELNMDRSALFRLARVYALASVSAETPERQQVLRGKALEAIENAGPFATLLRLTAEQDFDPLRDEPRFKKRLGEAGRANR